MIKALNMTNEQLKQKLFEHCKRLGNNYTDEQVSVLDISSITYDEEGYRLYHADRYCFEILKEPLYDGDGVKVISYSYKFIQPWDGFKNDLTAFTACELLKII